MNSKKFRKWCFTLNNYNAEEEKEMQDFIKEECEYGCFGYETGKCGTDHLQGYIRFKNPRVMPKINKRIHWEVARGTDQQASEYCKKDGDYFEWGTISEGQGKRKDLEKIYEKLKQGKRMMDFIDDEPNLQQIRIIEHWVPKLEGKRNWMPNVWWYYGPTGTGKSREAMEMFPNAWWSGAGWPKWWQGYEGEEDIVLDDIRANQIKLQDLLRILDRYPYTVEVKGGSRQLLAKNIVITCPVHPRDFYMVTEEKIEQLLRRILEIRKFGTGTEVGGNTSPDKNLFGGDQI